MRSPAQHRLIANFGRRRDRLTFDASAEPRSRLAARQGRDRAAMSFVVLTHILFAGALPHAQVDPEPTNVSVRPFQPGVSIDWKEGRVLAAGVVVLQSGPLEFFACGPGKEHESILRLTGRGLHLFQALGLIGLAPGHPPRWNEAAQAYSSPAGDLIDVDVFWQPLIQPDAPVPSAWRQVRWTEWLLDARTEQPVAPRPWVFAGSILRAGELAADRSGALLALTDFSDSLLALTSRHSSANAELWCIANSARVPPIGTCVWLRFSRAKPQDVRVTMDFRGQLHANGFAVDVVGLADLVRIHAQQRPGDCIPLDVSPALKSDVRELFARLSESGVSLEAFVIQPPLDLTPLPSPAEAEEAPSAAPGR